MVAKRASCRAAAMRKRCRNLQIIDPMFVWGLAQAQNLLTFDYVREFNLHMNVAGHSFAIHL